MSIASWIVPVLWRERDTRAALERLVAELAGVEPSPQRRRAALELGAAFEYFDPDRRRALAVYELAGHGEHATRALHLAIEIGWTSARARWIAALRTSAIGEAEAWWDAGHPDLCELALAGASADDERRATALAALLADRNLRDHAAAAEAYARDTGEAEACLTAARFARAMRRADDAVRWLEAALLAEPTHAIASSMLLQLAVQSREPEPIQRYLRLRLSGLDTIEWLDAMRGCAIALVESGQHRGLGLRTLRHTLERAYSLGVAVIPGHIAMWVALGHRAATDGTRRELLPLVVTALDASQNPIDRVWLAAFATEISLRDADNPVVAGAYAEIVAEYAPEHPVVRELVSAVARSTSVLAIPSEAVRAATRVLAEAPSDVDIELDDLYAVATEAAIIDDDDVAELLDDNDLAAVIASANAAAPVDVAEPAPRNSRQSLPHAARATVPPATETPKRARPSTDGLIAQPTAERARSDAHERAKRELLETPATILDAPDDVLPVEVDPPDPPDPPAPLPPPADESAAALLMQTLVRHGKLGAKQIAIPRIAKLTGLPTARTREPAPAPAARPTSIGPLPALPPLARSAPVLSALRTPDRPNIPPRAPDPENAKERARRIAIPIDVRLVFADGVRIDTHSRDISTTGLFVIATAEIAVGTELTVELLLPGKEAFTEDEYRCRARVIRREEGGYGIALIAPDPGLVAALDAL